MTLTHEMLHNIAKICHEANKAFCETNGDDSQVPWDQAPIWQKNSAIMGVELHLRETAGPERSHEAWMAQKIADGWAYGPVKDPEKKIHPCILPFNELPEHQQMKDHLFRGIVHSFKDYIFNGKDMVQNG